MAPRVGRLGVWVYLAPAVSTHAPARGATIKELSIFFVVMVSTHAPARGATRPCWMGCRIAQSFNPRAREGRDPRHTRQTGRWSSVSTHAPARGATPEKLLEGRLHRVSTHAPARGATVNSARKLNIPAYCIHFKRVATEKSVNMAQYTLRKPETLTRTSPLRAIACGSRKQKHF